MKKPCNWNAIPKLLTDDDKQRMEYFEVSTRSHTGKSRGVNTFFAEDEEDARRIMKKKGLPVYAIRQIKKP